MCGLLGQHTQPHAGLPRSFLDMDALMTRQLKVALIHEKRVSLMCLANFFDMHSMDICATWHCRGPMYKI